MTSKARETAIAAALAAFDNAASAERAGSFHTHKCPTCAFTWFHSDLGGLHRCLSCDTPVTLKHQTNLTFSVAQSISTHKDAI